MVIERLPLKAIALHKRFWAGEDSPDDSSHPTGGWNGAGCWGRKHVHEQQIKRAGGGRFL